MDTYNSSQLKLLYVMEYFVLNTDIEHPTNAKCIADYLNKHGLKVERKSIYRIIDNLNKFGINIKKRQQSFYYSTDNADVFHAFNNKQA